ncbi:c-type cytochrome [Profundibacterium mesophilum]|uniref:Cytochrome c oxidase subunit I n=1 Tax=Profundibacterium mesophilum KAUST100406-0324 TaxID=1037889 RepID=A0A921NR21_9RHOB|nr:c-type cytochrome [Profundibacterium mesophilum]KAF0675842.1 cytochrome c oxidase subunit I [Profundibacterium mesophilum KAUST100406-0324]
MRIVAKTLLVLALVGLIGAAAVVGLGLYNVSARLGHVPGLSWVLNTTFRNSVDLYAHESEPVPPLTADMVLLGARHYDAACKVCHARPGEARSATSLSMVPAPPHITEAVEEWSANEFHWIVMEGVKMSGMPYWPSERKDEVWAMVAFLKAVPSMSADDYLALTAMPRIDMPDIAAADSIAYCAGCHGTDGRSVSDEIPRLDILGSQYVRAAMQSYIDGTRQSGYMAQAVSEIPSRHLEDVTAYFAALPPAGETPARRPPPPRAPGSSEAPGADMPRFVNTLPNTRPVETLDPLIEAGRALAFAESGSRDVPACAACHGPKADRRSPGGPEIAGQGRAYIAAQLEAWRAELRGGGPRANLMRAAAEFLEDEEIEALAAYYASLGPEALRDAAQ